MALTVAQKDPAKFHAERLTGIGGSDAGSIVGLNDYKPSLQLYLEKRGEMDQDDLSENAAVKWGNILEDPIRQEFERATGKKVIVTDELYRSKKWNWMIAHVDGLLADEDAILECKTASAYATNDPAWGPEWSDHVPDNYLVQVQHYLAVTERSKAYLAVLIGGREFRIYDIPRDDSFIEELAEQERIFWECVQNGTPPEIDYAHAAALKLMRKRYNKVDGSLIVQLDESAIDAHERMEMAKEIKKSAECTIKQCNAEILNAMGNCAFGTLPDGRAYKRNEITKKPYMVKEQKYIDLRLVKEVKF